MTIPVTLPTHKDGTVDWFRRQITLERLMDRDTVHVGIINEPDDLVTEQLRVVLRVEVRFGRLGRVQLETLADTFTKDIERRVGFAVRVKKVL
jgi:hypothetical protein